MKNNPKQLPFILDTRIRNWKLWVEKATTRSQRATTGSSWNTSEFEFLFYSHITFCQYVLFLYWYIMLSPAIFLQLLLSNSTNEAYILQRPSSLFWCHSLKSLSCLDISSVTLTPMSSPDSCLSAGLLTPPPAKATLPKSPNGHSVPRPRVNPPCTFQFPGLLFIIFSCATTPSLVEM